MDFFDKASEVAASIGDKASDMIEVTKLKSRISSEKKAIELELAKIGRIYYEKQKNGEEELTPEALEICNRVDAHYNTIEETEKNLELYNSPKVDK